MRRILLGLLAIIVIAVPLVFAETVPDFNHDGKIDFTDFLMFARHYGASYGDETYSVTYDLNHDGEIDFQDFTAFAAEFGTLTHSDKPAGVKGDEELRALALEAAAKEYYNAENYREAVIAYRRMLELSTHPLHRARGMNNLARVYAAMGSAELAEAQFKQALAEYNTSTDRKIQVQMVWSNARLGMIYHERESKFLAFKYLEQARDHLSSLTK